MTFWLDTTAPRAAYRPLVSGVISEPDVADEPIVAPAAPIRASGLYVRGRRRRDLAVAVASALVVHVGLLTLLCLSASKTEPPPPLRADSGAIFASLTPASSISTEPSAEPPLVDAAIDQPQLAPPTMMTPAAAAEPPPPAEPDVAHPMQSAEIDQATLNTSVVRTSTPAPIDGAPQNPWAHASVATPDPTLDERLWAAIKPCWRDGEAGSSLRLMLDSGGRVQAMTDLEGGDALANPKAQPLARAVQACAPYDRLVDTAGSYLIVAPG